MPRSAGDIFVSQRPQWVDYSRSRQATTGQVRTFKRQAASEKKQNFEALKIRGFS